MDPEVAAVAALEVADFVAQPSPVTFDRIACGIDGSPSSHEAQLQAEILLAPGGRLTLVEVAALRHADTADLLVVGRDAASDLIRHAQKPLLVARRPPDGVEFPGRILVAAGGPGHPERAVRVAAMIAARTGASITLVDSSPRQIPALAARERAGLVVTGSRGILGLRAGQSTSAQIAREAPCSVLVIRPPAPCR